MSPRPSGGEARAVPPPLPAEAQKGTRVSKIPVKGEESAKVEAEDVLDKLERAMEEQTDRLNEIHSRAQTAWKAARDAGLSDETADRAMQKYKDALLAGAQEFEVAFKTPKGTQKETLVIPKKKTTKKIRTKKTAKQGGFLISTSLT